MTLGADTLATVVQVLWCYMCIFGRNAERNKARERQSTELIGVAGRWRQDRLNVGCLPVVEQREGRGVALVPVVGVAGFGFVAVALLGLVYLTIQFNVYRITFFAAGRDGNKVLRIVMRRCPW